MLAFLSCSAPRLDEFDPYAAPPSPSLPRFRRASRSLSFIKPPSRRRVSKMSIGAPVNFRHEFHLGMDIISSDTVSVWDATRFVDELRAQQFAASTPSTVPSTLPPPPSTPPPTPAPPKKRNSITPQKRKPVPSLIPDVPPLPADIPLPPSPTDAAPPPSPTTDAAPPPSSIHLGPLP